MPKRIEANPHLDARAKHESVFAYSRVTQYLTPQHERFPNGEIDTDLTGLSERLGTLVQDRLQQGHTLYIYDGSHHTRYTVQPIMAGQRREASRAVAFKIQERINLQPVTERVIPATEVHASFSSVGGELGVEIGFQGGEAEEQDYRIRSDGTMRPNAFFIVSEKVHMRDGAMERVEHELLCGKVDHRASIAYGEGHRGKSEWVLAPEKKHNTSSVHIFPSEEN